MPFVLFLLGAAAVGLVAASASAKGKGSGGGGGRTYTLDRNLPPQLRQQVLAALATEKDPARLLAFAAECANQGYPLAAAALTQRAVELGGVSPQPLPQPGPQPAAAAGAGVNPVDPGLLPDPPRTQVLAALSTGTDPNALEALAQQMDAQGYTYAAQALRLKETALRSLPPQPARNRSRYRPSPDARAAAARAAAGTDAYAGATAAGAAAESLLARSGHAPRDAKRGARRAHDRAGSSQAPGLRAGDPEARIRSRPGCSWPRRTRCACSLGRSRSRRRNRHPWPWPVPVQRRPGADPRRPAHRRRHDTHGTQRGSAERLPVHPPARRVDLPREDRQAGDGERGELPADDDDQPAIRAGRCALEEHPDRRRAQHPLGVGAEARRASTGSRWIPAFRRPAPRCSRRTQRRSRRKGGSNGLATHA